MGPQLLAAGRGRVRPDAAPAVRRRAESVALSPWYGTSMLSLSRPAATGSTIALRLA
jgi:hypothetical protein